MPMRIVFDGKSVVDRDLYDRADEMAKVIKDARGYLDPATMRDLTSVVQTNVPAIDMDFQRKHPGLGRLLVFRHTSDPKQSTAEVRADPSRGYVLRLRVSQHTKTVVVPTASRDDTAVAFLFPFIDEEHVHREPLVFIGSVGGNVRAVSEVYTAYHDYMDAQAVDDDYIPPTPAELALLRAEAKAGRRASSDAFVPRAEYEALRAELATSNKRRLALESVLATMAQHNATMAQHNAAVLALLNTNQ